MTDGPMSRVLRIDPFPPARKYNLVYGTCFSLNGSGTGNVYGTAQTFRLNSLFDPDLTGSGTQPYGFDQVSPIYNQYKVLRAFVELDVENTSGNNGTITCVIVPSAITLPTLAGANVDAFLDKPFAYSESIGAADGTGILKFRQTFDIASVDGLTHLQLAADYTNYSALVSANPTNQVRFTMAAAGALSAAMVTSVKARITFEVIFWDRNILAQS